LLPDPAQPATGDLQEIRPLAVKIRSTRRVYIIAKAAPKVLHVCLLKASPLPETVTNYG
jgi:hypothetical protein